MIQLRMIHYLGNTVGEAFGDAVEGLTYGLVYDEAGWNNS
jgi:hypothetical protein